jgi:miniconductance mechanosensitive channel
LKRTETILDGALVITITITLSKLIAAIMDALEVQEGKNQRLPVKVLGQALQVTLWTYASVVLLSVLSHRDVTTLLTGLTAVGAVLVYVFRDPILGWTASVQIAANDLAQIGDWITVPEHDADGWVIEIALTTIKVRNWDKTISTIPTYALVSEGFRNWRGMYDSGGRRIKRSVSIDVSSVHLCDNALLGRLEEHRLLERELAALDPPPTNLTCFRNWLEGWLTEHPKIHHDMPTMVRELAPDGRGIPVEIYAFSHGTGWVDYEHLQADIYDRVLAVLPEFELRVFQEPTGNDLRDLKPEESV